MLEPHIVSIGIPLCKIRFPLVFEFIHYAINFFEDSSWRGTFLSGVGYPLRIVVVCTPDGRVPDVRELRRSLICHPLKSIWHVVLVHLHIVTILNILTRFIALNLEPRHWVHIHELVVEWIFRVYLLVEEIVPDVQRQNSFPLIMWMIEPIYLVGHSDVGKLGEQTGQMFTKGVDVDLVCLLCFTILVYYGIPERNLRVLQILLEVHQFIEIGGQCMSILVYLVV